MIIKLSPCLANLVSAILKVRLWDYASGSLLDTCDVGAKVGWQLNFSCSLLLVAIYHLMIFFLPGEEYLSSAILFLFPNIKFNLGFGFNPLHS